MNKVAITIAIVIVSVLTGCGGNSQFYEMEAMKAKIKSLEERVPVALQKAPAPPPPLITNAIAPIPLQSWSVVSDKVRVEGIPSQNPLDQGMLQVRIAEMKVTNSAPGPVNLQGMYMLVKPVNMDLSDVKAFSEHVTTMQHIGDLSEGTRVYKINDPFIVQTSAPLGGFVLADAFKQDRNRIGVVETTFVGRPLGDMSAGDVYTQVAANPSIAAKVVNTFK